MLKLTLNDGKKNGWGFCRRFFKSLWFWCLSLWEFQFHTILTGPETSCFLYISQLREISWDAVRITISKMNNVEQTFENWFANNVGSYITNINVGSYIFQIWTNNLRFARSGLLSSEKWWEMDVCVMNICPCLSSRCHCAVGTLAPCVFCFIWDIWDMRDEIIWNIYDI